MGGMRARTYAGKRRVSSYSKRSGEYGGYQRGAVGTFSSRPNAMIPFRQKGIEIKSNDNNEWQTDGTGGYATYNLIPTTVGSFDIVNLLQSGSGANQRIGRRIEGLGIRIRGYAFPNPVFTGTAQAPVYWRTLLVYDGAPSGALVTISSVIQDLATFGTATLTDFASGANRNYSNRFTILFDKTVALQPPQRESDFTAANTNPISMTIVAPETTCFDEYRMLKGLATTFSANTVPPVYGDVATGAIWIITISNWLHATNDNTPYLYEYRTRYSYKDA